MSHAANIIRGWVVFGNVIHSDGWCGYHDLVDVGYVKHRHINHDRGDLRIGATTLTASRACGASLRHV